MPTKKKKVAPKKKPVAKKKPAAKKLVAKKAPAAKKKLVAKKAPVAKKKLVAKKAPVAKKKLVAKAKPASAAKPAPKSKPAPQAKPPVAAAAKPPAPKKPAAAPPKPAVAAAPPRERWTTFPPILEELVEWVNGGRVGEVDFEMYGSFNEQYKPSDWTRNPVSDEELFTFGMDGSGGQVAIWRRDESPVDTLPVVFLGSEGEVRPLAMSLPQFLHQLAHGMGPIELVFGEGEPSPNEEMLEWVKEQFPDARLADPDKILAEATKALEGFERHVMSQVKE